MLGNALAAPDAVQPALADKINPSPTHVIARGFQRNRTACWIAIALTMLLTFNGQWRIGLDSANYRGLADSLANGRGYTFGTWAPHAVYPGLPLMLAGLQKIFGTSALVPCICMNLMAIATLWLTYQLVALRFSPWIAIAVTFCVGTNSWFVELANELLTDMPFLLGVMIALYGWERMRTAGNAGARIGWGVILVIGFALAGLMRPTFWILVVAWGMVSGIGLVFGPRKRSAVSLLVLAGLLAAFVLLDPRSHGMNPFKGLPEQQAINLLTEGPETVRVLNAGNHQATATTTAAILWQKLRYVLHDQLPTAFFGQRCAPFSILASVLLIASTLLLWRNPLWVALVLLTFLVTVLLSAEPRYYVMVLPLLTLGWILMIDRVQQWMPNVWGTVLACGLLLLMVGNNISRDVPVMLEQRATPFLDHYRKGEYVPLIALAEQIRRFVPPGGNVLGPSGSVLSYLSGRHVWTQRELFGHMHEIDFPGRLQSIGFAAGIFPSRLYWDKEPTVARLMQRRIIVAITTLFATEKLSLADLEIRIPSGDWRQLPKPPPHVVHVKHKHKKHPSTSTAATQPNTLPVLAVPGTKP